LIKGIENSRLAEEKRKPEKEAEFELLKWGA
jgi:hypothetical protein